MMMLLVGMLVSLGAKADIKSVLTLDATEYEPGAKITVSLTNSEQLGAKDWVGVYKESEYPGSEFESVTWGYVSGATLELVAPSVEKYYVALLENDGYDEIAERVAFEVKWEEPALVDGVYQIGTASELEWFAEYVNGTTSDMTTQEKETRLVSKAVLTADIDMSGIDHQPIGATEGLKFNGEFDGKHHVISNLVINRPDDSQLELFGWVRGGTTLKNIIMDETCSITGYNRVGSIVGCVQTNVSGDPLEIINCVSFATLKSTKAAGMIGAGASQYPYFEMENCVNAGTITANDKASAFCGWNSSAGGNAKMYSCYNIGEIGGTLDGGSIFFRGSNREVKNCYDLGKTNSANAQVVKPEWKTVDPLRSGELCFALNNDQTLTYNANVEIYTQDLSDPNSIPMPRLAPAYIL